MPKPPSSVKSLRLPDETWAALSAEAERRGVSVNALIGRAVLKEISQWSDEEVAAMRAKPQAALEISRIPPGPIAWPSGAVILPEHAEDPGPTAALRVVKSKAPDEPLRMPRRPIGSLQKKPKGK